MYQARLKGVLKMVGGIVGIFVVRAAIPPYPKLVALPLALAFAGLLEVVSGVPFTQLQKRWDSMSGGRRYLLGLGVILCLVGGLILYLKMTAM